MSSRRASSPTRRPSTVGALSSPGDPGATLTRRRLLQGLLAVGGVGAVGGLGALRDSLEAAPLPRGEKILVLVTLDGGNDALNTVIPIDSGRYRDLRRSLAITRGIRPIGAGLGLHPNLRWMKSQHDQGRLATVLGIGEMTKDHSHFSCMARWMGGTNAPPPYTDGWLGRYLDHLGSDALGGVAVGNQGVPLVLQRSNGDSVGLPVIGDLFGADRRFDDGSLKPVIHAHRALKRYATSGLSPAADRLMGVQAEAIDIAVDVNPTFQPTLSSSLPPFIHDMELAARILNLDVGVRVVHVEYTGFDTHAAQRPLHDDMLRDLDRGLARFADTLQRRFQDRVVTVLYSEFGRRAARNGSAATDHGAAGAAFVLGSQVTGGIYGEQPSLRRLDSRGDLRPSLDHRSLYATVLDGWLGADPVAVLGGNYERLRIFDDPVYCQGRLATHVGTASSDVINGSRRSDVIVGRGGGDTIRGRGGDDLVCAGSGNDDVHGGPGRDRLYGSAGRDTLTGGKGRDSLFGGRGRDTLNRDRRDRVVRQ